MTKIKTRQIVVKTFQTVFSRPGYIMIALLFALFFMYLAIWLPNLPLLKYLTTSASFTLADKTRLLWQSFSFLRTNFTPFSLALTITIVLLSGINISLLWFYLKNKIKLEHSAGIGFLGTLAGLFGVGCASCGSVLLSSLFGLSATVGFLGVLPLEGAEFGQLGLVILAWSIYLLAKKIQNPLVCKS